MSALLHPLVMLKARIEALVEALRGAIEEKREDVAFGTTISDHARDFTFLAADLPALPRALELASDLIELVALLLLLKSARLVDRISRPAEDPGAREALLALIKKKAEILRETIDTRFLPLRPIRPPGSAPGPETEPTAVLDPTLEIVSLDEIAEMVGELLSQFDSPSHQVVMDKPTVQEMIQKLLRLLSSRKALVLQSVWGAEAAEHVAAFLATLDLAFQHRVRIVQEHFGGKLYMTAGARPKLQSAA